LPVVRLDDGMLARALRLYASYDVTALDHRVRVALELGAVERVDLLAKHPPPQGSHRLERLVGRQPRRQHRAGQAPSLRVAAPVLALVLLRQYVLPEARARVKPRPREHGRLV